MASESKLKSSPAKSVSVAMKEVCVSFVTTSPGLAAFERETITLTVDLNNTVRDLKKRLLSEKQVKKCYPGVSVSDLSNFLLELGKSALIGGTEYSETTSLKSIFSEQIIKNYNDAGFEVRFGQREILRPSTPTSSPVVLKGEAKVAVAIPQDITIHGAPFPPGFITVATEGCNTMADLVARFKEKVCSECVVRLGAGADAVLLQLKNRKYELSLDAGSGNTTPLNGAHSLRDFYHQDAIKNFAKTADVQESSIKIQARTIQPACVPLSAPPARLSVLGTSAARVTTSVAPAPGGTAIVPAKKS